MTSLCCDVLKTLRGKTLVTAESLTGGGIGAALTQVPGSSEVYKGGVICYTNWVKENILSVPGEILAQDGEYSQLVVNEYGKGHSVYFAGLPYSPQNCRILLRAIYYAAGMPEEMKHYYVTNVDTEVTVFPETKRIAVINNADAEEKTDLYIKGHLIDSLTLAPREMRWVDDAE